MTSGGTGAGTRLGAVVLVAGLGSRLGRHIAERPKCLLEVGGRSISARSRALLAEAGVRPVVFVVGYQADLVRAALDGQGVEFAVNDDYAASGTAWSAAVGLRHLAKRRDVGRVVLLEGDVLFDGRLLAALLDAPASDVTLVEPWRSEIDGSTVAVGPDRRVLTWTHTADRTAAFSLRGGWKLVNLHVMSARTAFDELLPAAADPAHRHRSLEYVLGMVRIGASGFQAVPTGGLPWVEVDDEADLERAHALFGSS